MQTVRKKTKERISKMRISKTICAAAVAALLMLQNFGPMVPVIADTAESTETQTTVETEAPKETTKATEAAKPTETTKPSETEVTTEASNGQITLLS